MSRHRQASERSSGRRSAEDLLAKLDEFRHETAKWQEGEQSGLQDEKRSKRDNLFRGVSVKGSELVGTSAESRSKSLSSLGGVKQTRAQMLLAQVSDDEKENGAELTLVQSGRRAGTQSTLGSYRRGDADRADKGDDKRLAAMTEEAKLLRREAAEREEFIGGIQRNYQTLLHLWKKMQSQHETLVAELKEAKERAGSSIMAIADGKKAQEELQALQRTKALLDKNYKHANEDRIVLAGKLSDAQTNIAELTDVKEEMATAAASLQQQVQVAREEAEALQQRLSQREKEDYAAGAALVGAEWESRLKKAGQEIEYQKRKVAELENVLQKTENVLRVTEMERDNLTTDLQRYTSGQLKPRDGDAERLQRLQAELESAATTINSLNSASAADKQNARALQAQFDMLLKEKDDSDAKLLESNRAAALASSVAERLQKALHDAQQGNHLEESQTVSELKARVAELEDLDVVKQSALLEAESRQETLKAGKSLMQSKINELQMQLQQLQEDINSRNQMEKAGKAAQAQAASMQCSLDKAQAQVVAEVAKNAVVSGELNTIRAALDKERADAQAQLSALKLKLEEEARKPKMSVDEAGRLRKMQQELATTVTKLVHSEESTEASYTCLSCIKIFEKPVTCIPCGHSFCKKCADTNGHCTECGKKVAVTYYPNDLLEDLTARYNYRKQALSAMKLMVSNQPV